ncbi:multidrug-resistance type transporter [Dionaea muscipula]
MNQPMDEVEEQQQHNLLILYATQTGNAMDAAERIAREAERRGCTVSLLSIDQFDPSLLSKESTVIFVVSTAGQGDTPDSMKGFWRFLLRRNISSHWLEGVQYAVFGLGDSGYQKYNFVAKKLDKRLADVGGTPIIERGLGDDQHPSGYEGALDPWISSLWTVLNRANSKFFPNGLDSLTPDTKVVDQPKVRITYYDDDNVHQQFSATSDLESMALQIEGVRLMYPGRFARDKMRPQCWLKMIKNCPLTRVGCGKDVRHLEFEFLDTAIEYKVGDVLEILPAQNPVAIDKFIHRCNLDPEALIMVESRETKLHTAAYASKAPIKLKRFVELTMDIGSASPRRYFFEVMSFYAAAEHEKERLQYFASAEGRDDLYQYNQKERRTVLEVLEDFPSVQMPFEWLVQLVPPLKTRAFSISSSPSAHHNQVHLTVNVAIWQTPFKRKRAGLCSKWLAGLDPQQAGVHIPVWFQKGSLPPPKPSLPLILVGPGTGCAPFRGFIAERAIESKICPTAPILFFFGCRSKDDDFLYKEFWAYHTKNDGVLSEKKGGGFYVAFSRDQPQKVYVQHKIKDQSKKILDLLNQGAAIYVAGSSTKMPSDVMSAFEEIISKEGAVPRESAVTWLRTLEKAGKYWVEAWS